MTDKISARAHTVSESALFRRVARRVLRDDGLILARCRYESRWFNDVGRYYAYGSNNALEACHIDLEAWTREAEVLRLGEVVLYEE